MVVSNRNPQHDVASVRRVERSLRIDALQDFVGAVHADVVTLLRRIAAIHRGPYVTGRIRITTGVLREFDLEAARLALFACAREVANTELAGPVWINDELSLRSNGLPPVATGVNE